jgi:hypothetical protein
MTTLPIDLKGRDPAKWGFFALMGLATLLVLWVDDRFWFDARDPHWKHISAVKWWLVPHGLFGVTALLTGAAQFSDTLRRARPKLHRWLGRTYLAAVSIAAPIGLLVGTGPTEPVTIHIEQWFQAGLWWLCAAIAFVCILNRQIQLHRAWMMRSYGFTLVFVTSRVPDAFLKSYSDQFLADMLWGLVALALFAPDVILTVRELARASARLASRKAA